MSNSVTQNHSINDFLRFLYKGLIILIIVFILDFAFGSLLKHYYFKQDSGMEYRTTYSLDHTTADILIFGSSRANHQYYPDPFEEILHMSYYNTGRDGTSSIYKYAILKGILKRYSPKVIIYDFEREELLFDQSSYDRLSFLLPYYKSHEELRPIIELKSPYERIKLISRIYPYNSSLFTIIAGNSEFNKKRYDEYKGYVPLSRIWEDPVMKDTIPRKQIIDSTKISYFRSFIEECQSKGTELYLVCPPYYIDFSYPSCSLEKGKRIAAEYNIDFLDYSDDPEFSTDRTLFADYVHFNDNGAKLFTEKLINDIIKLEKDP